MRLHDQLRDIDQSRASWQGQFSQQVADMRLTTESLRRETSSLATALRKPQVRGRWGEMHLRRAVELNPADAQVRAELEAVLRARTGATR